MSIWIVLQSRNCGFKRNSCSVALGRCSTVPAVFLNWFWKSRWCPGSILTPPPQLSQCKWACMGLQRPTPGCFSNCLLPVGAHKLAHLTANKFGDRDAFLFVVAEFLSSTLLTLIFLGVLGQSRVPKASDIEPSKERWSRCMCMCMCLCVSVVSFFVKY